MKATRQPALEIPTTTRARSQYGWTTACLVLGSGALAHAHPGHDWHEAGTRHLLTSPYHLGVVALMGLALWCSARLVQARSHRRLLQAAGLVVLATSGAFLALGF